MLFIYNITFYKIKKDLLYQRFIIYKIIYINSNKKLDL